MRFLFGAMSVGDILDRGLKVLFARLPTFYAIDLIVMSPLILIRLVVPFLLADAYSDDFILNTRALLSLCGIRLLELALLVILVPIAAAAVLHIVMQQYMGKRATLGEAFRFALSRFFSLLGGSVLFGLIVIIGSLSACVPGVYFFVSYAFVGQIIVFEKLDVGDGLQRSYNLVSGYRWRTFGVLLLIFLGYLIVVIGVTVGLQQVLPSEKTIPTENGFRVEFNPLNHIIDTSITVMVHILFSTFFVVCVTLLYLDLRIRKEGFDLELATQLDEPGGLQMDESDRLRREDKSPNRDRRRDRDLDEDWDDRNRDNDRPRRRSDW
jgi:hypothetical protein